MWQKLKDHAEYNFISIIFLFRVLDTEGEERQAHALFAHSALLTLHGNSRIINISIAFMV